MQILTERDRTEIQIYLKTFSDIHLKTKRIQVFGLCIFCISLLFLQPKYLWTWELTSYFACVGRYERYERKLGGEPYSILTEKWPEDLSSTGLCSGLAAAERNTMQAGQFTEIFFQDMHQNSRHTNSFLTSQQLKQKGI